MVAGRKLGAGNAVMKIRTRIRNIHRDVIVGVAEPVGLAVDFAPVFPEHGAVRARKAGVEFAGERRLYINVSGGVG